MAHHNRKVENTKFQKEQSSHPIEKDNTYQCKSKLNQSDNKNKKLSKLKKIITLEKDIRNELWPINLNSHEYFHTSNLKLNGLELNHKAHDYEGSDKISSRRPSSSFENMENFETDTLRDEEHLEALINDKLSLREKENKSKDNTIDPNTVEQVSKSPEAYTFHLFSQQNTASILIRDYVDQEIDQELNYKVFILLQKLALFQLRLVHEEPQKLKRHLRYITGMKLCLRYLDMKKLKAILIAPNLEPCISKGGLDDQIKKIKSTAESFSIPVVFALSRTGFKRALKVGTRHSAVGIVNTAGAENEFSQMLKMVLERKRPSDPK